LPQVPPPLLLPEEPPLPLLLLEVPELLPLPPELLETPLLEPLPPLLLLLPVKPLLLPLPPELLLPPASPASLYPVKSGGLESPEPHAAAVNAKETARALKVASFMNAFLP
jgi:hypothetical protein